LLEWRLDDERGTMKAGDTFKQTMSRTAVTVTFIGFDRHGDYVFAKGDRYASVGRAIPEGRAPMYAALYLVDAPYFSDSKDEYLAEHGPIVEEKP
jgi:hypothetical protein